MLKLFLWLHRCKEMEGALSDAKAELMKLEQLHKMLTQAVRTELSVLVETAEAGSEYKYSDNSASDILAELAVSVEVVGV